MAQDSRGQVNPQAYVGTHHVRDCPGGRDDAEQGQGTMRYWRAIQLFLGIVWRQSVDGSRMSIGHAWDTARAMHLWSRHGKAVAQYVTWYKHQPLTKRLGWQMRRRLSHLKCAIFGSAFGISAAERFLLEVWQEEKRKNVRNLAEKHEIDLERVKPHEVGP